LQGILLERAPVISGRLLLVSRSIEQISNRIVKSRVMRLARRRFAQERPGFFQVIGVLLFRGELDVCQSQISWCRVAAEVARERPFQVDRDGVVGENRVAAVVRFPLWYGRGAWNVDLPS
jgi:hypothetical protein